MVVMTGSFYFCWTFGAGMAGPGSRVDGGRFLYTFERLSILEDEYLFLVCRGDLRRLAESSWKIPAYCSSSPSRIGIGAASGMLFFWKLL